MADTVYNRFLANLANKIVDLEADTIRCVLLSSGYTIDADHKNYQDVVGNEVSGTGYTAGGKLLSNMSVTELDANDRADWDADDVSWTNSTITARYAVLRENTGTLSDLIAVFDFAEDKTSSNSTFTVQWNSGGIIRLVQG